MARIKPAWKDVRVELNKTKEDAVLLSGQAHNISAQVYLGSISPEDVSVRLYSGPLSSTGEIVEASQKEMAPGKSADGYTDYSFSWKPWRSGRQGYTVIATPKHEGLVGTYVSGYIKWAEVV